MATADLLRVCEYKNRVPSVMDVFSRKKCEVGFRITPPQPNALVPETYEVVSVIESKMPAEFGARQLNWDMAPADPSIPTGLELSYAGVDGRDTPKKGKFFLTADDHRQRRDFVKGDPKKERTHGWHWARVNVRRV